MSKQRLSGVWLLEFTSTGIPHIHVLCPSGAVSEFEVKRLWKLASGQDDDRCADVREVYDETGLASYLSKWRTKLAPPGFGLVQRWYGTFGKFQRMIVLASAVGHLAQISPIVRAIRKITRTRQQTGVFWGLSRDKAKRNAITRLISEYEASLGIREISGHSIVQASSYPPSLAVFA